MNHKPISKYILYGDEKDKEKYFLVLRIYEADNFELHRVFRRVLKYSTLREVHDGTFSVKINADINY